jgi:flagellin-like protein
MKKGITPIIAIIILLLITIGLAATAWTYLSGFLAGYTKSLQLVDSYCMGATTANVILRNTGPDPIALGASCTITDGSTTATCGSLTITRTDGGTFSSASINPSSGSLPAASSLTFQDGCTVSGTPRVCTYRFVSGGTGATAISITCG